MGNQAQVIFNIIIGREIWDGRTLAGRCTANRPRSAAVKYTYGPRIRASFDQCYGLVRNTEQRKAAIDSKITAESAHNISDVYGIEATSPPDRLVSDCRSVPEMSSATDRTPPSPDSTCNTPPGNRDRGDPSPVFVPVLMRELGISPRGVSEGGA
jgi:hypothetical protein